MSTVPGAWAGRRLHFVGVGGAGMSGLALIADALGATVTGSDRASSPYLERVLAAGIAAVVGHDAANVPDGGDVEIVVSTAIGEGNPERAAARERGLREIHRGALLGELSRRRRTIAIAGTHGKTTTASMAAHALLALGWDPTYVIGGELRRPGETGRGTNAAYGSGEWLVVEADESDRSFLELAPEIAVVDEHRARPPHDVRVACGARAGVRTVPAQRAAQRRRRHRGRRGVPRSRRDRRVGVLRRVGDRAERRGRALRVGRPGGGAVGARRCTTWRTPPRR